MREQKEGAREREVAQEGDTTTFVGRVLIAVAITVALGGLVLFLWRVLHILLLIFGGVLLAVFLRMLAVQVTGKTGWKQGWSMTLVVSLVIAILAGAVVVFMPIISDQLQELVKEVPAGLEEVEAAIEQYPWGRFLLGQLPALETLLTDDGAPWLRLGGVVTATMGGVVDVLVILFVGLYLAVNPGLYIQGVVRLFPIERRARVQDVFDAINAALCSWLRARMFIALGVGVVIGLVLWLMGLTLALSLALIAALLAWIPIIGLLLAAIPAGLSALIQNPLMATAVVALYLSLQILDRALTRYLIEDPGGVLPAALVVVTQSVMFVVLGPLGLIFATPLLVVGLIVIRLLYIEDMLADPGGPAVHGQGMEEGSETNP